jgi:hypothetical protein
MNPTASMNPTATREQLEKISDHESRRRGGLHTQHLLNHHHDSKSRPDCKLCNPPKPAQEKENASLRAALSARLECSS